MANHYRAVIAAAIVAVPALATVARAQDTTETRRVRADLAALRAELTEYQDEVDARVAALRDSLQLAQAGTHRFLLSGYGVGSFTSVRDGASRFSSAVVPLFLWQLNERVLFQAETEFELAEALETKVEYAHVSYLATDFLSVGAGKFLTPFTIFSQRLHPAWINKLPSAPLAFGHGGLVPGSGVGAYMRGGLAAGSARWSYALYGINAPELMTMGDEAGLIESLDEGTERAYGGRAGLFLMRPGIELGFSYQTSEVAKLSGLDVSVSRQFAALRGSLDARFEGLLFDGVDGPFQLTDTSMMDAFFVENRRDGGYGQLAYRPTLVGAGVLRNVELVGRYEWLTSPDWRGGEMGNDTRRYTAGVNFWLTSSMQLKVGLQRQSWTVGTSRSSLLIQTATGF